MKTIYFDHAATTSMDPEVFESMRPYLTDHFGNANSAHHLGRKTKVAIEDARESVASILNAAPSEIVFTSGGTESDNAVIKGVFDVRPGKEIITSPLEHHAVLHTVECTKRQGGRPVYLQPDQEGNITPKQVEDAITTDTALVSLMHVNNEIGTVLPLQSIAEVCASKGVPFHSDAVQSIGKLPVDVSQTPVDFLSMSAHKIHGPKGVGFMYVRRTAAWIPWVHGGSQEGRRRGGTSNVAGIVGLARALERSVERMDAYRTHALRLRGMVLAGLETTLPGQFQLNGSRENGVPHILNLSFFTPDGRGLDGEMLLLNLDIEGICVSNGSACTSGAMEPSHVLKGIGLEDSIANSSIRVCVGLENTEEDVHHFIHACTKIVKRMEVQMA